MNISRRFFESSMLTVSAVVFVCALAHRAGISGWSQELKLEKQELRPAKGNPERVFSAEESTRLIDELTDMAFDAGAYRVMGHLKKGQEDSVGHYVPGVPQELVRVRTVSIEGSDLSEVQVVALGSDDYTELWKSLGLLER
ncbi:MAG: hypothetical protein GY930_05810 [bacterium]|nr:hypothetical protein [bacterium]